MLEPDLVVVERLTRGERVESAGMDERKLAIDVLLKSSLSYSQIAQHVGVHRCTVYRHAKRSRMSRDEIDRRTAEHRSEIRRRYESGQSQRFIAAVLGISRAAVRQHMAVMGMQSRPRVSRAGREHWTSSPGSSYWRPS